MSAADNSIQPGETLNQVTNDTKLAAALLAFGAFMPEPFRKNPAISGGKPTFCFMFDASQAVDNCEGGATTVKAIIETYQRHPASVFEQNPNNPIALVRVALDNYQRLVKHMQSENALVVVSREKMNGKSDVHLIRPAGDKAAELVPQGRKIGRSYYLTNENLRHSK